MKKKKICKCGHGLTHHVTLKHLLELVCLTCGIDESGFHVCEKYEIEDTINEQVMEIVS